MLYTSLLYAANERINQEGRILGPLPAVTNAILFNTTNADAVVSAMQIFPVTNPWNECISNRPVLVNSDAMIAQIISDLAREPGRLIADSGDEFRARAGQPAAETDRFLQLSRMNRTWTAGRGPTGCIRFPRTCPLRSGRRRPAPRHCSQWQTNNDGSDRHAIMVAPGGGFIWETWETTRVGTNWEASNGAKFNLNTNGLRPDGWTSGDAAGFPMFPALVRYDEAERGMVEHACRLVWCKRSRYNTYIYPATHYAAPSGNTGTNLPAMGQRLRLKAALRSQPTGRQRKRRWCWD